jgi:GLPGLI family protein
MMYRIAFLLLLIANCSMGQYAVSGTDEFQIEYQCLFNDKFERGKQFFSYDARLQRRSGITHFYSIPNIHNQTEEGSRDIIIEADTFLRVVKNIDRAEILFGITSFSGKEVLFRDSLFPMVWNLEKDDKMIDSFQCFKATTYFKGRNYIAWYCPKIPLPDGPWKLGGLPGLILEAYDENKDLYFMAKGIQFGRQLIPPVAFRDFQQFPDYPGYIKYMKNVLEKLKGSMSAQDSPDCVSCETKTKLKIYVWEKVLD